jgi:DNA-binding XRE family transcriptional regulator
MTTLEAIAERRLGKEVLKGHPKLRAALGRGRNSSAERDEAERIAAVVELCFEYERETDPEEKENILRTLEEISANEPAELSKETIEEFEGRLMEADGKYRKADAAARRKSDRFLKKYFSFRSKAGLATQADVARKSGLSRGYVAVLESGEHTPQQKTLQKLAKAFGVDVTELMN